MTGNKKKGGGCLLAGVLGLGLLFSPLLVTAGVSALFMAAAGAGASMDDSGCFGSGFEAGDVKLSADQEANVAAILERVSARGLGAGDAVLTIMVADTESTLTNVNHGDTAGPDSRGLFQQRDPWGPLAVRMDPGGATDLFLNALTDPALKVYRTSDLINATATSRAEIAPWLVGQSVQHSGYADGSNYRAKYERAAQIVAAHLTAQEMATANVDRWSDLDVDGTSPIANGTSGDAAYCENGLDIGTGNTGTAGSGGSGPGAWGGYSNGQIPDDALCPIPWATSHRLRCDAVDALTILNDAYTARFGHNIAITDSYRTYTEQVAVKAAKGFLAAKPGTSNHGWGLALDLADGMTSYSSAQYQWMRENAPGAGWDNPNWARPGGTKKEPWHWEFGKVS